MKKIYIIVIALAAGCILLPAKATAQKELKKANRLYERLDYSLAIPYYLEHFKTNKPDAGSAARLAHCYRLNNNTKEAEAWYATAIALKNSDPENVWYYAEALKSNRKYAEAKEQYKAYGKLDPAAASRVDLAIRACDEALAWLNAPAPYEVTNEEWLNSPGSEFGPVLIGNGLIFSSDRMVKGKEYTKEGIHGWSGRPYIRLFYTEQEHQQNEESSFMEAKKGPMPGNAAARTEMTWKEAMMLPDIINEQFHNGPAVYDTNDHILYFTRTRKVEVEAGEKYPDPTSWPGTVEKQYVNRLEIWMAEKKSEGEWTNIKSFRWNNAERYSIGHPAISPDGKILYFSSDMPGGYGATDIYYCELKADGTWGQPVNAGADINTEGRESFPVMRSDGVFYFASDGHTGMGGLDLFSAKGAAANWKEVENLRAPFNSPKDDFGIVFTDNDSTGYFASDREGGKGLDDIYSFKPVKKPEPVKDPMKLVFPVVYYDFDKSDIRSDAEEGLKQVIQALVDHPDVKVEVAAHCDCRGSAAYNMKLSQRRAESAYNYLVQKGIDKQRLNAKGYGENQPVNDCMDGEHCSESDHQKNRRTEFKITVETEPIRE